MTKSITIAGGGLAGLTLGLILRQRAVPVAIWEAGDYPRHRVCGEFVSGSGLEVLQRLGLLEEVKNMGGCLAHSAAWFDQFKQRISFDLPKPALCISRYRLDALLAEHFEASGGVLKTKARWKDSFEDEGIVRATGRRPPQAQPGAWRWFGLKVHCRNLPMIADLEMHVRPKGYVGLCRLAHEEVNLCGLFRTRAPVPALASEWKQFLIGAQTSPLAQKLQSASYDEASFCAIAALDLKHQSPVHGEIRIGDALGMIPPATGNGMSIAFESAELAAEPLGEYSKGRLNWQEAVHSVGAQQSRKFSTRLSWARVIHPLLFNSLAAKAFCSNRFVAQWLSRMVFEATR